jgi:hypothetical protein
MAVDPNKNEEQQEKTTPTTETTETTESTSPASGSATTTDEEGGITVSDEQIKLLEDQYANIAQGINDSYKAQENAIVVVEDFTFEAPKTKEFINLAKNLKVSDKKVLLVLPEANKAVYLSARNVERANVALAASLNTYSVLNAGVLVVTESSLKVIDNILTKKEA